MMPVHLLHRGHLNADALWFDADFLGEAEARRRLLEAWRPGCRVQRLRGGYLLQFVSSSALPPTSLENTRRMTAAQAPGLILVAEKERYSALELPKNAPSGPLIWARGGDLVAETPGETVDPGSWLELGPIHRGQSLGRPPPPPALPVPVVTVDLRAQAGVTLDPRTAELLAALAEKRSPRAEPSAEWARGPIGALLRSLFPPTTASGQRLLAGPAPATPPPERSFLHKQWVEFLLRSGLYGFIQNRQEEYLQELFSAFEAGDLNDALRRAIPMADPKDAAGDAMPAVGLPQPREQLRMTPGGQGSQAMHLEEQARETLRTHYRRAAQRLLDQGRVDEAVFVLSELLRDHAAAVTTLERAQRWLDAAKLAELRGLDPSLRVRLWLEAGEEATAIHIARQSGVFSPVVTNLEKQHPLLGERLRRLWARSFADRGALYSAVLVLWDNPATRSEALPLLKELERGDLWLEALPYHLSLVPEQRETATKRLREVGKDLPTDSLRRLSRGLQNVPANDQAGLQRGLQRLLAARPVRKRWEGPPSPLMQATLAPPEPGSAAPFPEHRLSGTGLRPLLDGLLRQDRVWVALGEEGVEEWDRRGRRVRAYPVPAQSLIADATGEQALAVIRRGTRLAVSHLDLLRREHKFLVDLRADLYCSRFDGQRWFVACGDELYALDATDLNRVLWRVQLSGTIVALSQGDEEVAVWTRSPRGEEEGWLYRLSSMTLSSRSPHGVVVEPKAPLLAAVHPHKYEALPICQRPGRPLQCGGSTPLGATTVEGIFPMYSRIALTEGAPGIGTTLRLYYLENWELHATVHFPEARGAWARYSNDRLLVGSDGGQLAVLSEAGGELEWELRI